MSRHCILISLFILGAAVFLIGCSKKSPSSTSSNSQSETQQSYSQTQPSVLPPETVRVGNGNGADTKPSGTEAGSLVWMTDFEAAKSQAAREGKDLFMDFSGSDWCGWCKRLDREVFSKEIFAKEAQKYFVFVLVDFPNNKSGQSSELQKQNKQLYEHYKVKGFPTIFLADASGKAYAQTGYQEGGPIAYIQHLAELRMQKQEQ